MQAREGERSTKSSGSQTGSSRQKCFKEDHSKCLFKKLETRETRWALAAILSIVGVSTTLALVPTPSLCRRHYGNQQSCSQLLQTQGNAFGQQDKHESC